MPRKQRFKPSRKPKPIPQTEAGSIPQSSGLAHNDNAESRNQTSSRNDDSSVEPDPDQQSR
jgi:hypothetical protein